MAWLTVKAVLSPVRALQQLLIGSMRAWGERSAIRRNVLRQTSLQGSHECAWI